ncbi:ribosomal protein S12 methylthiotransferase RimO [Bartonella koehlerae C-29]|uniref:Ribosomal protein S12 methylthiotransferase RimO n=1 Tax=Bartonella koehlerae C-29 TaxID=1134510 RepID=A0A067WE67_9HYPH|nr:ribosomal protein S12 methylthiotransferase RimO [Bartonella koehlerae C-29]
MAKQQKISTHLLKKKVGKRLQILIDESQGKIAKGLSQYDAPEIDGVVYISSRLPLRVGEFVIVKIERSDAYDLYGIAV